MTVGPYVDTRALAKWYLSEPRSADFDAFITKQPAANISRLTVVEFHSLLARRMRAKELDRSASTAVIERFIGQIAQGYVVVHPLDDRHAIAVYELFSRLARHPLRTLDALHLVIAIDLDVDTVATADKTMAAAAKALGFRVAPFD